MDTQKEEIIFVNELNFVNYLKCNAVLYRFLLCDVMWFINENKRFWSVDAKKNI